MPNYHLQKSDVIFYQDFAPQNSKTIVLLHGLGATSESWELQVPDLIQAKFRVVCPDIPGFGRSRFKDYTPSVNSFAIAILSLINYLGIESVDLAGISMGGALALMMTISAPRLVRHTILANTFYRLPFDNITQLIYYATRFAAVTILGKNQQARIVAQRVFPKPEQANYRIMLMDQIRQSDTRGYRAAMLSLAKYNVEKQLADIRVPVLILSGGRDTTIPLAWQRKLAQKIKGSRHVIIPDGGHGVSVDSFRDFNQHLLAFLNKI
jgi:pimeloyl-ACP methyl ester carboxylesterase